MATDTRSENSSAPTTTRWVLDRLVVAPVQFALLGGAVVLLTEPVRAGFREVLPMALPYFWAGIVVFTLLAVGESIGNRADDVMEALELTDQLNQLSRREAILVMVSLVVILSASLSAHLGAVALATYLLGQTTGAGAFVVAVPFVLSPLDAWVGRQYGISAALLGLDLGVAVMKLVVRVQGVTTAIPTQAGFYGRSLFTDSNGRERPI